MRNVLQILEDYNFQARVLYPEKLSLKLEEEEKKSFSWPKQVKAIMNMKPALKRILEEMLGMEKNDKS